MDFKIVIGDKDGKAYQQEIKGPEAENLLKKRIGQTVSGAEIGLPGYEFLLTGGSDKAGFPMRKGIQEPRKKVLIGKGVGFRGKKRALRKKKTRKDQQGLLKRRTVCGEMVTTSIRQLNLKVVKSGPNPLASEATAEALN